MTASTEADCSDPGAGVDIVDLAGAAPQECMALSTAAHWNQTEQDWRTMLALGHGWGLRQRDGLGRGTLVASTLVLPYESRFAWISMVLVAPEARGQGHASRLLRVALDDLAARRLLPLLDATPAGRPVYLKQGFVDAWGFERWRCKVLRGAAATAALTAGATVGAPQAAPPRARPLRESDWPALAACDAAAFGASRLPLLRALAARLPSAAWVVDGMHGPRGLLLGRDGRTALQLGPLVADDGAVAMALLSAALGALRDGGEDRDRDLIVDLRGGREALAGWLRARAFEPERPFMRMVHGAQGKAPGDARRVCLVAGPELG